MRRVTLQDLVDINQWLVGHGHEPEHVIPEVGFIVPGVAVGFLRMVEGDFAIVDGLTSNPAAPGADRHAALDAVILRLIEEAKAMKLKALLAWSVHPQTIARAKRLGFSGREYTSLGLDLTPEF